MKKVLVSIQPIIRIHVRNNGTEDVLMHPTYNGSIWGEYIRVYNHTFDICDEAGNIVYNGDVSKLHARLANERTFDDGVIDEFRYSPVEDCYVGF